MPRKTSNAHAGASITKAQSTFERCHCRAQLHSGRFVTAEIPDSGNQAVGEFGSMPDDVAGGLAPEDCMILRKLVVPGTKTHVDIAGTFARAERGEGRERG
jgi:hypothetical protein